jgi:phosphoglycerate dehydrogenase-like enzyme
MTMASMKVQALQSEFTPSSPLTILLSTQAAQAFGSRVSAVLEGVPHRLIHLEDPPTEDGTYPAHVAFLSRDITGNSGKTELDDTLVRFYEIIRGSPRLQWLQMAAAGADRPIYAEMRRRNVAVTTGSGSNAVPVAQMAFTGLLALARQLPRLMDAQRRKSWEPLFGPQMPRVLKGQTAVVVGLGPIGLEIARLLRALDVRIIGLRRRHEACSAVDETFTFKDLSNVLPRADWVLLACPLTDETRGMINARTIELLPRGAHVVNVARGEVIREADLVEPLRSGRLAGACLDVLEKEPLSPESPLWDLPNLIITPHTASHTTGHYAAVGDIFLDNLQRWREGRPLRNPIP